MIEPGDLVEIIDPIFSSYGTIHTVIKIHTRPSDPYDLTVDVKPYGPTAFRYSEVRKV